MDVEFAVSVELGSGDVDDGSVCVVVDDQALERACAGTEGVGAAGSVGDAVRRHTLTVFARAFDANARAGDLP